MAKPADKDVRLGKLELRIMNVVWDRGRATVQDVKDALSSASDKPAYSTVLTMMRKIEAKGYLRHELEGRTYVYLPTLARREARRSLLGSLVDRLFEGSAAQLVSSLIEEGQVSESELAQIRKILNKRS